MITELKFRNINFFPQRVLEVSYILLHALFLMFRIARLMVFCKVGL